MQALAVKLCRDHITYMSACKRQLCSCRPIYSDALDVLARGHPPHSVLSSHCQQRVRAAFLAMHAAGMAEHSHHRLQSDAAHPIASPWSIRMSRSLLCCKG